MNIQYLDKYFPVLMENDLINIEYDEEGLYSITPPNSAILITKIIKTYFSHNKITVTDGCAGLGGNVFSFASSFETVFAIEQDCSRFMMLVNNIAVLQHKNVLCINGDMLNIFNKLHQDVIFMDPPWGGIDYKYKHNISIKINNMEFSSVCEDIFTKKVCLLLVLKLPLNYNNESFSKEIKQVWTVDKMKKIQVIYIPC